MDSCILAILIAKSTCLNLRAEYLKAKHSGDGGLTNDLHELWQEACKLVFEAENNHRSVLASLA